MGGGGYRVRGGLVVCVSHWALDHGLEVGMSWCEDHKNYRAQREPSGLCGKCWALYFYKNPESREGLMRVYREAAEVLPEQLTDEA